MEYLKKIMISDLILLDKSSALFETVKYPWDLINSIPDVFSELTSTYDSRKNVIINDSDGPVVIDDKATIEPFTVLNGPLFIGKNTLVKSHSTLSNSIINHDCKVSGEIHSCIFQPYSNKAHDGFLGHSFIGSWANLGAGTTTSNLKNNYSSISVKWDGKLIDTKSIFFGSIIGEHVKTAIGTNLNTGTVIELGCNIVSQSFPPRHIAAFSLFYKNKSIKIQFDNFCDTAEKAMQRRNKSLSSSDKSVLNSIYKNC
jgi:UDP-N-acetylglucosamine diphosphorylase/glucosamine-1-phosphate N-acetyltransferase|tara:strand:- start:656 stop:1423 length:768 start_codon:yes stop_codon:yes gene_type:complete